MRAILLGLLPTLLFGCTQLSQQHSTQAVAPVVSNCLGELSLPDDLAPSFTAIEDPQLLAQALGEPEKGGLCQGQVYQSNADAEVVIYRAWNSTNPHSQFGQWWAFDQPSGKVAMYRSDYEICYQWSPLDKLVRCTLKPGSTVVVGNGQSAKCSEYLSYPASEKQQVFIQNADDLVTECSVFDAMMSWQEEQ